MIDDEEKGRDSLPRCEKSMSLQQGRSPPTELGKEMERQDFVPQRPLPVPRLPLPSCRLQGNGYEHNIWEAHKSFKCVLSAMENCLNIERYFT